MFSLSLCRNHNGALNAAPANNESTSIERVSSGYEKNGQTSALWVCDFCVQAHSTVVSAYVAVDVIA